LKVQRQGMNQADKAQNQKMVWRNAGVLLVVVAGLLVVLWERNRNSAPLRTGAAGQIVFVSDRGGTFSLWQVDASSTIIHPLLLARNERVMLHPTFSPDGSQIAYISVACPTCMNEIFVAGSDGRGAVNLSQLTGAGNYEEAQWSPDSAWLLLVRADLESGQRDLLLTRADGSDLRQLTSSAEVDEIEPAWSPDGRQIAYVQATVSQRRIWVMDVVSGATRPLTPEQEYAISPAWSPDGTQLVYVNRQRGSSLDLWLIASDGSQPEQLTFDTADELAPVWSPDGNRIAYQSAFEQDDSRIMVLERSTGRIHDLTAGRGHAFAPVWSPDGSWLAFTLANEIVITAAAGGELLPLTNHPALDQFPAWRADP
jgi:TolB protein